jgi:beta-N-acetylhexosaminidase
MNNKIGALVIDLQGLQLDAEEKELLAHPLVGGLILFARNYENPLQLQELCRSIRAARSTPLLIMADQEGGRVQRFRQQFFPLPSLSFFGECYDRNPTQALELSKAAGWLMASEVMAAGIDLSLAPVIDLNKGISSVIGTRAFHTNAEAVFRLAHAYIQGMREAGMTATIKHFPGHGSVQADSHLDTPVDERDLKVILEEDLQPFQQLIAEGIHAVMAAHIIFPRIDKRQVSFSRVWLHDILRERLNFTGVILSDDLNMQGANISTNYAERVIAAREAGCDFALLCNNRAGTIQTIDTIPHAQHQVTADKWQKLKADFSAQRNTQGRSKLASEFLTTHINALKELTSSSSTTKISQV